MKLNFQLKGVFDNYPSKEAVQIFSVTLLNLCLTSRFTSPSSQAAIYYEDGSNNPETIAAFTYTSDQTESDCNFSH